MSSPFSLLPVELLLKHVVPQCDPVVDSALAQTCKTLYRAVMEKRLQDFERCRGIIIHNVEGVNLEEETRQSLTVFLRQLQAPRPEQFLRDPGCFRALKNSIVDKISSLRRSQIEEICERHFNDLSSCGMFRHVSRIAYLVKKWHMQMETHNDRWPPTYRYLKVLEALFEYGGYDQAGNAIRYYQGSLPQLQGYPLVLAIMGRSHYQYVALSTMFNPIPHSLALKGGAKIAALQQALTMIQTLSERSEEASNIRIKELALKGLGCSLLWTYDKRCMQQGVEILKEVSIDPCFLMKSLRMGLLNSRNDQLVLGISTWIDLIIDQMGGPCDQVDELSQISLLVMVLISLKREESLREAIKLALAFEIGMRPLSIAPRLEEGWIQPMVVGLMNTGDLEAIRGAWKLVNKTLIKSLILKTAVLTLVRNANWSALTKFFNFLHTSPLEVKEPELVIFIHETLESVKYWNPDEFEELIPEPLFTLQPVWEQGSLISKYGISGVYVESYLRAVQVPECGYQVSYGLHNEYYPFGWFGEDQVVGEVYDSDEANEDANSDAAAASDDD